MSSRKNVLLPFKLLDNISLSSTIHSQPVTIQYLDNIGITLKCTGVSSNTGAFTIECSIDGETWVDIGIEPAITLNNANDNMIINLNNLPFSKLRVAFTPSVGSPNGVVEGYISGKEL